MPRRIAWLAPLLAAGWLRAQEPAPALESILARDLRADLFFLAGDGLRGRLTNTPENRLAADFIKARFERLGLAPAGPGGSFYHPYNLMTATLGSENRLAATGPDGVELRLAGGQGFYPLRFSASGRVSGSVVFAGFGVAAPALGYDDYRGTQVKGNVVLVLNHEPGEADPASPFDGVVTAQLAGPLEKTLAAQAAGAVGILFVTDVHNHPGPDDFEAEARGYWPAQPLRIDRFMLGTWVERVRIPVAQISPALAEILLRSTGKTLHQLAAGAETARGGTPVMAPGNRVELVTSVDRHVVPDRNVLAAMEGADPDRRSEWVVVSAHFDHNGADGDQVFNGADDDGSGIVGLLEIAEAYALAAQAGRRPRRSVLFAAWNSEERGLLGAWAYVEAPRYPLERTVGVLNMDMIGRNEEVQTGGGARFRGLELQTAESNNNAVNILGYSRTPDLWRTVQDANAGIGLDLKPRYDNNASNLLRRSDHWPFLQRGVPAVWVHTGLHPDYHTVYDRPEKINYQKMEKIARLVYQASWMLASGEGRPAMATSPQ
ncbi:MAG TPA: M28 family peptidase [Gemmatimonadales bacterium]|nr:M28 family peptidase [Gemmatimonadales bacterium]